MLHKKNFGGDMKKMLHETYWSCRFISAYAKMQKAKKRQDMNLMHRAKLDVVLSLTYLGKYDFEIAEFAHYTRMKFSEDEQNGIGWI
jgi:hypothetical protein